jgi:hypothetical protein
MANDYEGDDILPPEPQSPYSSQSPQGALLAMMGSYTSPEAKKLATRIFNEQYDKSPQIEGEEDSALGDIAKSTQEARAALVAAREKLMNKRYNNAEMLLAMSSAFASPTRTGGFGETIGNVTGSMIAPLRNKRMEQAGDEKQGLEYAGLIGQIDRDLARNKMDLYKSRRTSRSRLMSDTLGIIGKETRGSTGTAGEGGKPMSPEGKEAADRGFTPGTKEFSDYVAFASKRNRADDRAKSGTDVTPDDVADKDNMIMAQENGVPFVPFNPILKHQSVKERQNTLQTWDKAAEAKLSTLRTVVADQDRIDQDYQTFMQANRKLGTNILYKIPVLKDFLSMGVPAQTMEAITAHQARDEKRTGEGSVSNFDAQQFRLATVSTDKRYDTNAKIAKAQRARIQRNRDYLRYLENYKATYGHLNGSERYWREYVDAVPIFDKSTDTAKERIKLNENFITPEEYFRSQMAPAEDVPAADAEPAPPDTKDPNYNPNDYVPAKANGGVVEGYAEGGKVGKVARLVKEALRSDSASDARDYLDSALEMGNISGSDYTQAVKRLNSELNSIYSAPGARNTKPVTSENLNPGPPAGLPPIKKAEGGPVKGIDLNALYDEDENQKDDSYRVNMADLARAAAQGASFNFSDEMLAKARPGPYKDNLTDERASLEQMANNYPISNFATQAAGALPVSIGGTYAAEAALKALSRKGGKAGKVAALVGKAIPKSNSGKLIGAGAISGAIGGAGASQEPGEMPSDIVQGGLLGGTLAPLGGLAAKYGTGLVRYVGDRMSNNAISGGDRKVLEALSRDGLDLGQILQRLQKDNRAGVPSVLADVGGSHTDALAGAVAGKPGKGPIALSDLLEQRQGQAGDRVGSAINKALKPDEYYTKMDDLTDALYANAKPLYEQAYAKYPKLKITAIDEMAGTKVGKQAIKRASEMLKHEGRTIGKIRPDGSLGHVTLEGADAIKRALDDTISKMERTGTNSYGKVIRGVRNRLRDELDAAAPEYKTARAQFAGDLEVRDALKMGREEYSRLSPKELQRAVDTMSFAEKDALRSGVAEYLYTQMSKAPRGANPLKNLIGNSAGQEKLRALFDKPKEYEAFVHNLETEFVNFEKSRKVLTRAGAARADSANEALGGSPATRAAKAGLNAASQAVLMGNPGEGSSNWALANTLRAIKDYVPMSTKTADEAALNLMIGDPGTAAGAVNRLRSEAARVEQRMRQGQAIAKHGTRATAVAQQPAPRGAIEDQELERMLEDNKQTIMEAASAGR